MHRFATLTLETPSSSSGPGSWSLKTSSSVPSSNGRPKGVSGPSPWLSSASWSCKTAFSSKFPEPRTKSKIEQSASCWVKDTQARLWCNSSACIAVFLVNRMSASRLPWDTTTWTSGCSIRKEIRKSVWLFIYLFLSNIHRLSSSHCPLYMWATGPLINSIYHKDILVLPTLLLLWSPFHQILTLLRSSRIPLELLSLLFIPVALSGQLGWRTLSMRWRHLCWIQNGMTSFINCVHRILVFTEFPNENATMTALSEKIYLNWGIETYWLFIHRGWVKESKRLARVQVANCFLLFATFVPVCQIPR